MSQNERISLQESLSAFGRIGIMSFGGPAAQIALMHRVLVEEKRWLEEKEFLSALSFCMLLPGPEAMQLATYSGWRRHGVAGGLMAGLLFVLPGAMVMAALAAGYAAFGSVRLVEALFLGIKAAVRHKLGKDSVSGVHVAIQGTGSVGGGVARLLAKDGAKLTLSDINEARAAALADELGGESVAPDAVMSVACDVFSPNALGAILDDEGIARLDTPIVAGGANNQLARAGHGEKLAARGILYAPDYVINAGGIISVAMEYLCKNHGDPCDINEVRKRIAQIPGRLEEIWHESDASGVSADVVADRMAQKLIGR